MKLFTKQSDGGKTSGVTAYTLIEWKPVFSLMLLHFNPGTREAFHSHAFNAVTLWLKGRVEEQRLFTWRGGTLTLLRTFFKAGQWKKTTRDNLHRVNALGHAWALTFRGPWKDTWQEFREGKLVTLTHGRKVVLCDGQNDGTWD